MMPDEHPLSVAAARTLALQNADVAFLLGARFNWIFHFGQPSRYAKDTRVIQLDIAPKEIDHRGGIGRRRRGDPPTRRPERLNSALGQPSVVLSEGHTVCSLATAGCALSGPDIQSFPVCQTSAPDNCAEKQQEQRELRFRRPWAFPHLRGQSPKPQAT
jgi:hypothetical protein